MASKYARRHYQDVAAVIASMDSYRDEVRSPTVDGAIDAIMHKFADLFEQDNPNFKRDRFLAAVRKEC